MADITPFVVEVFEDGKCSRAALYAVNNCSGGDTVDVGSNFRVVKRAGLVSQTGTHIAAVTTISGTVLTIPTGPSNDGVWLLVIGVATG